MWSPRHPSGEDAATGGSSSGRNEAALDQELAIAIDADERAGPGDFRWVVAHWTVFECGKRGFDLAKALIDLIWQLIGFRILLLEATIFAPQRFAPCLFLVVGGRISPVSRRTPLAWPYGKSIATAIHFQRSAPSFSASRLSF
jgi:hypothetical protein